MLKEKLVFATIAASVLFACDYGHATILSNLKNALGTAGKQALQGAVSGLQNGNTTTTTTLNTRLTIQQLTADNCMNELFNQVNTVVAAKSAYDQMKQAGVTGTALYNAAKTYSDAVVLFKQTATQAQQILQTEKAKMSTLDQNLNYVNTQVTNAGTYEVEASQGLATASAQMNSLPGGVQY